MVVYMYLRDFFALNPLRDYILCSVCIFPTVCSPHSAFCTQPAFYSKSAVCLLHSVCILPLVRSPQSAVRSPQSLFTVTGLPMQPSCSSALSKLSFKMATTWSKYFFFFSSGFAIFFLVVLTLIDIQRDKFSKQTVKSWMQNHILSALGNNLHAVINKNTMSTITNSQLTQPGGTKTLLLIYTLFFGTAKWIRDRDDNCGFENKFLFAANKCLSGDFELTYDKQRFEESDLVVFHARNMPSVDHLRTLLKNRSTSQRWVYALWESPNATPNPAPLNGLFNSTWTFRSDSDFWSPYGSYEELSEEEKMNKIKNIPDYSQGKTELVAWMVSNCGAQPRMAFAETLRKYIKVDVFGRCSGKFGQQRGCGNLTACLKTFKFYLAFENALCEDYITEKYWGRLGKTLKFLLAYTKSAFHWLIHT